MRPIFQFNINFVVAHKLEAKPLIEHFHLKKFIKEPFQVFKNESGIRLIISGMGASRARSAVEYMWQLDSGSFLKRRLDQCWDSGSSDPRFGDLLFSK